MRIRTLSLWQPWASAVAITLKRMETRGWVSRYRGPLAIHAAQKKSVSTRQAFARLCADQAIGDVFLEAYVARYDHLPHYDNMPRGAIICLVRMRDCVPITKANAASLSPMEKALGDFRPGRMAWAVDNARPLLQPHPVAGRQGFFWVNIPDRLLPVPKPGECRLCGCTESDACISRRGQPCHWVEENLCSACVEARR